MSYSKSIEDIAKRRHSAVLVACIYSAQFATSATISALSYISNFSQLWIVIYYFFTLFAAIPQSGLSDVYGRKKHLVIALVSVFLSTAYLSLICLFKAFNPSGLSSFPSTYWTILPACIFLGISGNVIPIARAGIADLKIHDFRTAMGWSTTFIGFGWITANLLGFIFDSVGVLVCSMSIGIAIIIMVIVYFKDQEDETITPTDKIGYINTFIESYKWCISMFFVAGGAAAILAYFFTETTFYQIYTLNEDNGASISLKVIGIFMAFGYALGVTVQWIISCSDKNGIKIGIAISLLSLLIVVAWKVLAFYKELPFSEKSLSLVEGFLEFAFASGFGFSVPSLFSLMSTKISSHHAGKLFGTIDTTDTFALGNSSFINYLSFKFNFRATFILVVMLSFFLLSFKFYMRFLKRFSTYEHKTE